MFKIQLRNVNGRWKDSISGRLFETKETAMEYAKALDEDGFFDKWNVRIVKQEKPRKLL